jgi:four helix bundle protein
MQERLFDHERLEVYQLGRQFNRQLHVLLQGVRRGYAESRDNLVRAGKSITRNTAEGSGRWTVPDKVHFYHIARASATECAASLDELVDFGAVTEESIREPKKTLSRIVAMLVAMIHSLQAHGASRLSRSRTRPVMRPSTTNDRNEPSDTS